MKEQTGSLNLFNTRFNLQSPKLWNWAGIGAALLYILFAILLGFSGVGLQYDEALLQHGAVQMLNSANEPTFAHDRGSWVRFAGRYWPLMVIPYVGSVKDYLLLVPFALLGPSAEVARAVNALLGAFGIWGIAKFLKEEINVRVAVAVAFVLAIHPAYLMLTVYDNGTVVVWMACLGLISLAVSRYKKRKSSLSAFWVGATMGISIWNRVNFIWFLASAILACALVFRKRILIPGRHFAALIGGGVIGGAPLLLYQLLSNLAILRFMKEGQVQQSFGPLLVHRLQMLSETLLSDNEHRTIWNGPAMPIWQVYFFPLVLAFALIVCFLLKNRGDEHTAMWRRASALTFVFFTTLMFTSRLGIAPHHLVTLVPIAAMVVVLAFQGIIYRWRRVGILALSIALVYVGSALYWNVAAAQGLRETRGVNMWSDAVFSVEDYLQSHYQGREIKILDWGLHNNLFVLSNAKIRSSEIFWGATRERTGFGAPWSEVIPQGGLYLTNTGGNLHFPAATEGFRAALAASGQTFNRVEFYQKTGAPYGEIIEVSPSSLEKPKITGTGTITANPNPIKVCDGSGLGATTLSWTAAEGTIVEVRVGAPDGPLLAQTSSKGSSTTGKWITDETIFYLQDVTGRKPLTSQYTIATITVNLTTEGCP